MPGGIVNPGLKSSVTVAEQDADIIAIKVGYGQVGLAIIVEIAGDNVVGLGSYRVIASHLKGSIAIAGQDGDVVGIVIDHGQVQTGIAIEIIQSHRPRPAAREIIRFHGKGAVAIADEHGHSIVAPQRGDQIEIGIAIELSGGDSFGAETRSHTWPRQKGTVKAIGPAQTQ